MTKLARVTLATLPLIAAACGGSDGPPDSGGPPADAGPADAGRDAGRTDAGPRDGGTTDSGPTDSGADDGGPPDADAPPDAGPTFSYDCGAFSEDTGWTVRTGFRAVVVADATDGLSDPVALTFAEGPFGGLLYVVNQGDDVLRTIDVSDGTTTAFVSDWGTPAASLLTTIVWDERSHFDGNLYVGDQRSDGDQDSTVYRVDSTGAVTVLATAPGAGMDDIYGLAFPPPGTAYPGGLYVTGDTDGGGVDWGIIASAGTITPFSEVAGVEGIAFDTTGLYGDTLWASRPLGGGYAGDGSITPMMADGTAGTPIATGLGGIHAVTFSTTGAFGRRMFAASWSADDIVEIAPDGTVTELASGLVLTNYDGNILDVSSDGNVMFVADRESNQVVCIEPI